MTDLHFDSVDIPANTSPRSAEPNPFDGHFPADTQALRFTLDGAPTVEKDGKTKDAPAVAKLRGQSQKAANKVDRSARFKAESNGKKGKAEQTIVTVWTVAKITRERKDKDAAAAASASNPNTATA